MQSNVERIVTEAYSELEASVVRFLKSVDELTASASSVATDEQGIREIRQELRTRTKDLASLRTRYREKEDECRHAQKRTNDLEASLQFVGRPSPSKGGHAAHTT